MNWNLFTAVLLALAVAMPAAAQPPRPPSRDAAGSSRSLERWVRQLENDIEHLQEDLFYERGSYPAGLSEQVEQASRAVTHFHHILRRGDDRRHLMRDFQEMDRQVHQLVSQLNQSGDAWLRRQAQRIAYSDDQVHYALRTASSEPGGVDRELLARHAHLLESEANNLRQLVDRLGRRDTELQESIRDFAEEAEHFHEVVERGGDAAHLVDDFQELDEEWHRVVEQINRSGYGLYLRRTAQNVDRVHNQIHQLVTAGHGDHRHDEDRPRDDGRSRVQPRQIRPGIEVEIPGVGRFRIPR